ncbi:MAG TPA: hypothetical protein VGA17_11525 [Nitrospiraceae bacterium]
MAKRGGKRPGAGRPKGSRDTATIEQRGTIEELARANSPTAMATLVTIATTGESEAARVSAANSILDRGYGKPMQAMEHSGKNGAPLIPVINVTIDGGA